MRDRIGATVATDDGALKIGRPACVGPGCSHEQVGNRTALDGPMQFGAGPECEDGAGNRVTVARGDRASRQEEPQRFEQVGDYGLKV